MHERAPTAAIAVIGRAEHSDCMFFVGPVEAFHDQLVRARYEGEVIGVVELL